MTLDEEAEERARAAVDAIWRGMASGDGSWRSGIGLLCEMASDDDPEIAGRASRALFAGVIERLNDSFAAEASQIYPQLFARVIDIHRRMPEGALFDAALAGFGLSTEEDLVRRHERLLRPAGGEISSAKRVVLLSRVTIGADVAITSVLLDGLMAALPAAEFVLLGSAKLRELYGGEARIRVRELGYARGGRVMTRLDSWRQLLAIIEDEGRDLNPGEMLVIDPDSRLTQLGLLPVSTDETNYRFFPSRSYRAAGAGSLSELAAAWVGELVGAGVLKKHACSFVALPEEHLRRGEAIRKALIRGGSGEIATISLGTGGNEEKRLAPETEVTLLRHLCRQGRVILDKGGGPDEQEAVGRIVNTLRDDGLTIVEASERDWQSGPPVDRINAGLIAWDGGIGSLAGLIAASDRYIGYDSSGQHLAAAMSIPATTIFITSNPPAFIERWNPGRRGRIVVAKRETTLDQLVAMIDAMMDANR